MTSQNTYHFVYDLGFQTVLVFIQLHNLQKRSAKVHTKHICKVFPSLFLVAATKHSITIENE